MNTKKKYVAPCVGVIDLGDEILQLEHQSRMTESDQNDHSVSGKKHKWSSWDDDVEDVGTTAGTGKSALELPSGGKLWED